MKHNKSSRRQILEAMAERVTGTRHVNRWMILLMDLFISAVATIMIFWIMGYILDAYTFIKVGFRAAGISLVCAFVAFMIFGTHKEILRYTTSREIGVLVLAVFVKTALELTCLILVKKNLGLGREIINAKLGLMEVVNFCVTVSGLVFFRLFLVHRCFSAFFWSISMRTALPSWEVGEGRKCLSSATMMSLFPACST